MKNMKSLTWMFLFASALASCTATKTASQGNTEDDEAYYNGKRTFVTEIPAGTTAMAATDSTATDDYYDPNSKSSLYDQFNRSSNYTPGFGNNYSSGFGNSSLLWRPYVGWGLSNFGSSMYYGNSAFYGFGYPYNSWYSPYYGNAYCYSPYWNMGYFPWNPGFGSTMYNPYGMNVYMPWPSYSFYGNNYFYTSTLNDGGSSLGYSIGHRKPLGAISSLNSSSSGQSPRPDRPRVTYYNSSTNGGVSSKGNNNGNVVQATPSGNQGSGSKKGNGSNASAPSRPTRYSSPSSSPSRSGGGRDFGGFSVPSGGGGGGGRSGGSVGGGGGGRSGGGGSSAGHRR